MNKVIVFDLGGTLMEFKGMPPVWTDYYKIGFENINRTFKLNIPDYQVHKAAEIMKSYNPRVNYRENEITPEIIFTDATRDWNIKLDINKIVKCFFDGLNIETVIYDYSFCCIIATLNCVWRQSYVFFCAWRLLRTFLLHKN